MPDSDPSDGEITDADEFLREIGNIERDETLIDFIGQGYDVNAPGDQDVADLLGAWRDGVGRAPVNVELPSAAIARGAVPRAPTRGGTMSIAEDAAHLAALAGSTAERGAVQQAMQGVEDIRAQAMSLLGSNAAQGAAVGGAAEAARAALEAADGAIAVFLAAISDAASYHGG